MHVLELHLLDAETHLQLLHEPGELRDRIGLDSLAADREDLVHRTVAHHLPHHALREVAERGAGLPHVEEIGFRIGDLVLHHPLDVGRVEVTGDDVALPCLLGGDLIGVRHAR